MKTAVKKKSAGSSAAKSSGKTAAPIKQSGGKTLAQKPVKKTVAKGPAIKKHVGSEKAALTKKISTSGRTAVGKESRKEQKASGTPVSDKNRLKMLKQTLISKRDAIVNEAKKEIAKYASGEHRQLVDTALDDGDWAVVDISEDLNLLRLAAHRKMLVEIDEALRKIAEGSYGICEECGEEISEKRLSVLPAATLCVSCKENREQLEVIERTEGGFTS